MWLIAFLSDDSGVVEGRLFRAGIECFNPMCWQDTVSRGKKIRVQRPLYPKYLFTPYHHKWHRALAVDGVVCVLGETREDETFWPHKEPDSVIDKLRRRMEEGGGAIRLSTSREDHDFEFGDFIDIINGPATGWKGIVDNRKPKRGQIGTRLIDNGVLCPLTYFPLHFVRHSLAAPEGLSAAAKIA